MPDSGLMTPGSDSLARVEKKLAVNPSNDPSRPQWPSLHFEAYVVRVQNNYMGDINTLADTVGSAHYIKVRYCVTCVHQ